ncbi:hypothetical protein [Pseudomonas phage Pa2]|uniref:Uncharacterized protein n=2 Tax=Litunavirus Ab09 TaxID=1920765 RepID=A0A346CM68_9CAUD|nr:hypothetical protein ACQ21_p01 [Pseudomonas phage Pa2]AXL96684.1 hypothetical protein [Pseudomonas phage Pa2]AXL96692.1 hypothetical protein [Pseudomonas phage phi176]
MSVYLFIEDNDNWTFEEYSSAFKDEDAWENAAFVHASKGKRVVRLINEPSFRFKWAIKKPIRKTTTTSRWVKLEGPPPTLIALTIVWGIDIQD